MRTFLRGKITLLFMTFGLLLAIPAIALADVVTNNLDGNTIDNTAEVMPLQVGGDAGTTKLYVANTNTNNETYPDTTGNNGCNLAGTSNLQLDVTSSDEDVATVDPASVTINDCGESFGVTLTVSPVAEGSTTITVARKANTDTSAPGKFYYEPATFTVNVTPPPNTPPEVSISGVEGGANYEINDVPTAKCDVTDEEDGNSQFNATLTGPTGTLASYGLGQVEASCSYEDAGGEVAEASLFYNIVDTGAPVITRVSDSPASPNGSNQWYTSAVTTTFQARDFNGTIPTPDTGAGFANHNNPYTFTVGSGTAEGDNVSNNSGTVEDVAGNVSNNASSGPFKIDLSNPTNVEFSGGPDAGGSYFFGDTPAAPTCTADDAISGLDDCVVTGYSSAVGNHTMTATATDNAGRTATAQRSYTVKPYTLNGFYQPIDMNNTVNTVKNGSTVPVKFELFKGTTELTSTSAVTSIKYNSIPCGALAGDPEDAIETVATGGTSLRYDATSGQFVYNWTTPKGATQVGKCYTLTMTAADSSTMTAYFKLK